MLPPFGDATSAMAGVAIDTFVTSTGETGADAAGAANSAAGTVVATSDVGGTGYLADAVSTSLPIMSVQVTRAAGAWASRTSGLSPSIDSRTSVGSATGFCNAAQGCAVEDLLEGDRGVLISTGARIDCVSGWPASALCRNMR